MKFSFSAVRQYFELEGKGSGHREGRSAGVFQAPDKGECLKRTRRTTTGD